MLFNCKTRGSADYRDADSRESRPISAVEEHDMQTTRSKELADEYLRLGGKRLAKIDDNIVKIRHWEDDTPEAEAFWQKNIEPLDERRRVEVETHLPTINDR